KCLPKDARDAVLSFMDIPENFNRVVHMLERPFGRPEQMISTVVENVKDTQPPCPKQLLLKLPTGQQFLWCQFVQKLNNKPRLKNFET
ncbi:unnamed protein product, partial [Allacma fusca]